MTESCKPLVHVLQVTLRSMINVFAMNEREIYSPQAGTHPFTILLFVQGQLVRQRTSKAASLSCWVTAKSPVAQAGETKKVSYCQVAFSPQIFYALPLLLGKKAMRWQRAASSGKGRLLCKGHGSIDWIGQDAECHNTYKVCVYPMQSTRRVLPAKKEKKCYWDMSRYELELGAKVQLWPPFKRAPRLCTKVLSSYCILIPFGTLERERDGEQPST